MTGRIDENDEDIGSALSNAVLGQTNTPFVCIGAEEHQQAVLRFLGQTNYHLDILSHYFEPRVYDNEACLEAFEDLALRSQHHSIRILLYEPQQILQRGHVILELGKRLSSFFAFRRPQRQHRIRYQKEFLLADGLGYMHRPYPDALKSEVNFSAPLEVRELSKIFEEAWTHAEHDPNLRRFII